MSPDGCNRELGIADGRIKDNQLSASSAHDNDFATYGAHRARLNITSWPPGYRANAKTTDFHWVRVSLHSEMVITAIATQGYGEPQVDEWVSNYMLLYYRDGDFLYFKGLDGNVKVSMLLA